MEDGKLPPHVLSIAWNPRFRKNYVPKGVVKGDALVEGQCAIMACCDTLVVCKSSKEDTVCWMPVFNKKTNAFDLTCGEKASRIGIMNECVSCNLPIGMQHSCSECCKYVCNFCMAGEDSCGLCRGQSAITRKDFWGTKPFYVNSEIQYNSKEVDDLVVICTDGGESKKGVQEISEMNAVRKFNALLANKKLFRISYECVGSRMCGR